MFCFFLDYSLVTFNWSVLIIITRPRRSLHNRPPVGSRRELIRFSFRDGNDLRAISSVKVIIHQHQPLTTSDFFFSSSRCVLLQTCTPGTHTHTHSKVLHAPAVYNNTCRIYTASCHRGPQGNVDEGGIIEFFIFSSWPFRHFLAHRRLVRKRRREKKREKGPGSIFFPLSRLHL